MSRQQPSVSIMIPVLNEERHLREVVLAARAQNYEGPLDVVVSVGPSSDRTEEIAHALAAEFANVTVVANPTGRTPDALNAALTRTTGEFIIRCDGHAMLPPEYVSIAVETLLRTGADNVGGIMDARGETTFQRAVAWAMKSKFGVGSAAFHVGGAEGEAETVYLGCFRASALARVGGYDTKMTRAQDWEMNHRIRATGGLVWFNPALRVTYRPRRTVRSLALQYRQYGQWRRRVMHMHPETISRASALRYFAPPAAVIAVALGTILGVGGLITGTELVGGFLAPLSYLAGIKMVALSAVRNEPLSVVFRIPVVLFTMHMNWGWGFLTSPAIRDLPSRTA